MNAQPELAEREKRVLIELLKNSKVSDKELARKLSTSQPTITRIRNKLYEQGYILHYTIMPKIEKAGLKLMAFTFLRRFDMGARKKLHEWISAMQPVIFSAEGEGLREQRLVMISAHTDFDKYEEFMHSFRSEFGNKIGETSSFLIPSGKNIKEFNLCGPIEAQFRLAQGNEKRGIKFGSHEVQIPQMPPMPRMPLVKMPHLGRKRAK